MDYKALREKMVGEQLKARGIKDERVLNAFLDIPREIFVPQSFANQAYADSPIPIGENQTISQPYTTAFMTELLELKSGDTVLEIGAGSGYAAAILGKLCKQVYTVEVITVLAVKARDKLKRLNISNVTVIIGDGSIGLKDKAPFDAIAVTAAAPKVPNALISQLKIGGRLVVPVGNNFLQKMVKITKTEQGTKLVTCGTFRFVPLIGKEGWKKVLI
ncbi:protein-L-isoaspartate O-methyltransferase [candidate division WWE3 bacterium CG09_land_8_20_14_0_10_39_24]|uniref:Protein-L-isoaspartate O-methyltransferase n=2 Tax=Katanobacteria TaxID=422282 RepID=A0A2G9XBT3_UNCKA|nr:MAG: protein-L-isoaspartate O-methyltransferase [bacterium CG2_30_40_12]OJI08340.1 MAG: protein-L-isoaspartate O-methyltransferase [bacterium CG09_39_24]PIP04448.1 MAG: protein-L-isoaspartate O-methyltransferase [candidate division WWE3 bacterium CG23_combo_of_CG06-09_8_20_14_all_40_14]PIS12648.1 MAG: protein-L-isoaspartate O-methyltransferase [candidate division WWE3 bacterium CG09_land_8_20_14_0_10_39_24]